jgi:hypothetical protein
VKISPFNSNSGSFLIVHYNNKKKHYYSWRITMKNILKITILSALFVLTSCAHHSKCCKSDGKCEMKAGCDKNKEQCPMKAEAAPAKTEAAPVKK